MPALPVLRLSTALRSIAKPLTLLAATIATIAMISPANSSGQVRRASSTRPAAAPVQALRVTMGEGGSHIMGNPAAPVRLVEFVSYTCVHCSEFSTEAGATLRNSYVAPGRISLEVRHIVRDPVDMAMAVATNCGAPARFFRRHDAMMAAHNAILNQVRTLPTATTDRWNQTPLPSRLRMIANDSGVTAWMRQQGFTPAAITACMANTATQERLVQMSRSGLAAQVEGTPSFALNGHLLQNVYGWASLRPALDTVLRP